MHLKLTEVLAAAVCMLPFHSSVQSPLKQPGRCVFCDQGGPIVPCSPEILSTKTMRCGIQE